MWPQLVTGFRLVLGAEALILAIEGDNLPLAATLIVVSVVIGSLNERLAAWLNATGGFGERFAALVDYTTFIITPWVLMRALLIGRRNLAQEALLDLPLLAGAIRYARDSRRGLSPVFFAFVAVTGIFLQIADLMSIPRQTLVLPPLIAALSLLMLAPWSYPRLPAVPGVAALVLIAAMPFFQTEVLAAGAVLAGLLYIVIGPFAGRTSGTVTG